MGATETDLHYLELTELAAHIRARQISPATERYRSSIASPRSMLRSGATRW
jgi:hypothetical protein